MLRILAFGIGCLVVGSGASLAQSASTLKPAAGASTPAAGLNAADREFLQELGRMRIGEVESSEIAVARATSAGVRKVAEEILSYHRRTDPALVALAADGGVELPRALDKERSDYLAALRQKSGAEFDQSYLTGQKSDHEQSVALFRKVVQAGQDPMVRAFVNARLGEAQAMQRAVSEVAKTVLPNG